MLREIVQKKINARVARGLIVIDKEAGVTSHDEINRLRRIFKTKRVGHSGTLDPKVTGVLVCGLGRGTKVLEYVLLSQKIYDCEIIFHKKVTQKQFEQVLKKFQGKIVQLPPVKSSVKRIEREREIYNLELLDFASSKRSARIRCSVERGTYIRKLCHDMGIELQTGAHMGDLRRIAAGPFNLDNSKPITVSNLNKLHEKSNSAFFGWIYLFLILRYIEPVERMFVDIPRVIVDTRLQKIIASGADIFAPGILGVDIFQVGDTVQVVDQDNTVFAIGEASMNSVAAKNAQKGVAVRVTKILCG